eukprot:905357-Amphidinium_carterae.1
MAQMLANAGAHAVLVRYVRETWKCPTCQRRARPDAPRPAAVPRSFEVNQVVGVDLMEIEDPLNDQAKLLLLNVIDWGSHYQQVVQLKSKQASIVWKGFCEAWSDFGAAVSAHGSLLVTVNTRTPWEAGKTEKGGGLWKDLFRLVVEQERPVDSDEVQTLISLVTAQRNSNMNRAGFSPHQRVFGIGVRTPSSLTSTDNFDPVLQRASPSEAFHRAEHLRQTVARAWLELDSKSRLAAALRGRNRRSAPVVAIGEAVYVWRQPKGQRGAWQGPGLVTMVSDRAVWVTVRHALWKVPPEHVRPATSQESLGIEVLNKYMASMQQELASRDSRRGPRRYIDGMREQGPSEEGNGKDALPMASGAPEHEQNEALPMASGASEHEQDEHAQDEHEQDEHEQDRAAPTQQEEEEEEEVLPEHDSLGDDRMQGETAARQEEENQSPPSERAESDIVEDDTFRAEAAIIRSVLQQAPPLQVPASWQNGNSAENQTARQREQGQDESITSSCDKLAATVDEFL